MADLEEHAIKRDKGFLVRLVLGLGVAALVGTLVWIWISNADIGGCAAESFGNVTHSDESPPPPPEGR